MTIRPSALLQTAANQMATREWWTHQRYRYDLFVSQVVIDECAAGDTVAASERLNLVEGIPLLEISEDVSLLAEQLLTTVPLPPKAEYDALHIAISAVHGIEYLLTWNCRHIANATLRSKIESICRDHGVEPPVICTPAELWESNDDTRSDRE